jgi:hypothetical protein
MSDPLRDLEMEVANLRAHVNLQDAKIRASIARIEDDVARLKADAVGYVPFIRYVNVERIVYGMVSVVLLAVITSLAALVVRS